MKETFMELIQRYFDMLHFDVSVYAADMYDEASRAQVIQSVDRFGVTARVLESLGLDGWGRIADVLTTMWWTCQELYPDEVDQKHLRNDLLELAKLYRSAMETAADPTGRG
jgi:hypothetical protein